MHNNNARRRIWIIHFHAIFPSDKSLSRHRRSRAENLTPGGGEQSALSRRFHPSLTPLRVERNVSGEKEEGRIAWTEGRKEGSSQAGRGGAGCGPLSRDLALCCIQAIARPWKIHGLARGEQMPPTSMSPLFSRLPVRSATISSYYRNIRFNGERQGITMHDTTPPLPWDETRHFPSGNLFFSLFLSLSLARSLERASGVNSARVMFPFNGVRCVYGFRSVWVELEEVGI